VLESGPARRTALAGHELLLVLQQRPVLDQLVQVIVRKMLPAIGITIAVFVVVFVGLFPLRPHYAEPEREGDRGSDPALQDAMILHSARIGPDGRESQLGSYHRNARRLPRRRDVSKRPVTGTVSTTSGRRVEVGGISDRFLFLIQPHSHVGAMNWGFLRSSKFSTQYAGFPMVFVAQQNHFVQRAVLGRYGVCWPGPRRGLRLRRRGPPEDLPVRPPPLATHLLASFNNIRVDIDTIVAVPR
jgi:hypothetical protein